MLRTNGDQFEIVEINPFMLSLSKHAPPFLSSLLQPIKRFGIIIEDLLHRRLWNLAPVGSLLQ